MEIEGPGVCFEMALYARDKRSLMTHVPTCTGCDEPDADFIDINGMMWHEKCHREFITEYNAYYDELDVREAFETIGTVNDDHDIEAMGDDEPKPNKRNRSPNNFQYPDAVT